MVIIRENTEGLYSGIGERTAERATDLRVITRARLRARDPRGLRAVARSATRGAPGDGKRRVTCIVKHNVLQGCRLFLDVFREVAAALPRRSSTTSRSSTRSRCSCSRSPSATTSASPPTCSATSSPTSPRCSRAAWAWPSAATSATTTRCSSRSTARRRRSPARTARTRWRCCSRPARRWPGSAAATPTSASRAPHAAIEAAVASIVERGEPLTADLGGTAGTRAVAAAVRDEVDRRLRCAP